MILPSGSIPHQLVFDNEPTYAALQRNAIALIC